MPGIRADLLSMLAHLPGLDSAPERKAFLTFAGYAHLGIYLDYSGSTVQFAERLIEELSRLGKRGLVEFLDAAQAAPQVLVERKDALAALRRRIDALDGSAWQAEFPVELLKPEQR